MTKATGPVQADEFGTITALSPLDGRYRRTVSDLAEIFSESGLMRERVRVELRWLLHLTAVADFSGPLSLPPDAVARIETMLQGFDTADARRIKEIEREINHDVKAVEYFVRERVFGDTPCGGAAELVHFACTSEDINNLAYGLMLKSARDAILLPAIDTLVESLKSLARRGIDTPMLARTHGQPATPTTVGKELANFVHRLTIARRDLETIAVMGKLNGAVGNFNAHYTACPEVDWPTVAQRFVESLGLTYQPMSTQIEPHDQLAAFCHALSRLNTVLIDLDRDFWAYIAIGYFRQKAVSGEVGSSTMPHKVNPIDFENAEGNLGVANALLGHFADKLPVSRWQRDLSDSTVLRNLGVALGHSLIGYRATTRGLGKLDLDPARLQADLDGAWEVLAEAVQTVLRRHGVTGAYEKMKALSRGRSLDRDELQQFIDGLPLPDDARERLLDLTPSTYLGNAADAARRVLGAGDED